MNMTGTAYQTSDAHTELKVFLIRKKMSQRKLAVQLKITPQYLNEVLTGKRPGSRIRKELVELGLPIEATPPPVKTNKKRAA